MHNAYLKTMGLLSLLLLLLCLNSSFFVQEPIQVNQWLLWDKEQGVEIYVRHSSSSYDSRYNTQVRVRNTNNYEVTATFIPTFQCDELSDEVIVRREVKVNIYPRHAVTLLADRPCSGAVPKKVAFEHFKVRKR
jgi:hypothetical protein